MHAFDVDVAIAGAGPAGTAAAIVLARAGRRVLLVDNQPFPRDKVCGDLLGSDAIAMLIEIGIDKRVLAGGEPLAGAVLHGPRGTRAGSLPAAERRPARRGDARVLPRRILDMRLLDCARDAGAEFAVGRVSGVLRDASGRIAGLRTSAGDIAARVTIGAEGWRSPVARSIGTGASTPRYTAVAVRTYATGTGDLEGRMHFYINPRGDGYAWVFPLGDRAANVGLGYITSEPGRCDLRGAFARFCGPQSPARSFLADATFEASAAWPIPLGWREGAATSPGALLAGDAANLASPLSGSGIHNALASGTGAGSHALRALAGDESAWAAYARWSRGRFALRLRLERAAHDLAGTPERVEPWLALSNTLPGAGTLLSRALLALG